MSLLSLKQFQELINTALEYQPHRDRFDGEHPSAEIFTGAGNVVNAIRLKFYVQDDGGTWDNITIIKPQFLWDMKKLMAGTVIDDGIANRNAHLTATSISETDDGLNFYEIPTSKLVHNVDILNDGLNFNNTIFNCWFRPSQIQRYPFGALFIMESNGLGKLGIVISTDTTNSERFTIRVMSQLTDSIVFDHIINGTQVMPFIWDQKYNLIVSMQNAYIKVFVNGHLLRDMPLPTNLVVNSSVGFTFGMDYRGEISYATLSCYWWHDDNFLNSFWKYGYPLPRGPELVDLSDYFEQKGKNLLIDVGDINKAIENIRGQLYVKTNTVKLRDL
jgi:hypothetical protein